MFEILENGQVMKYIKSDTFEMWVAYGMETQIEEIKDAEGNVIETIEKHFNLKTGEWA
jgi:hypothetical protein